MRYGAMNFPIRPVIEEIESIGRLGFDYLELAMDAMGTFAEKAKQLGLRLCLENMFSSKYQNFVEPEDLAPVLAQFPDLELTLDTGHAHINQSNRDRILAFIEQYPNRIGHLHISDNAGDQDAHLPVGQGTIRFQKVMAALKLIGYDDTLTLEIFTDNRNDLLQSRERIAGLIGSRK